MGYGLRSVESPELLTVILMTILQIKGRSYCELSDVTSVSQMFPFNFVVSLEWLHNSPDFHLNNYGGKMTVALKDKK